MDGRAKVPLRSTGLHLIWGRSPAYRTQIHHHEMQGNGYCRPHIALGRLVIPLTKVHPLTKSLRHQIMDGWAGGHMNEIPPMFYRTLSPLEPLPCLSSQPKKESKVSERAHELSKQAKRGEPCKASEWSDQCDQTKVVSDQVACQKRNCVWLETHFYDWLLQISFGSSWRAILANHPLNLDTHDSNWSIHAFSILQWSFLTYFLVVSSCYQTWVAWNHRQTGKKLPPFYLWVVCVMDE